MKNENNVGALHKGGMKMEMRKKLLVGVLCVFLSRDVIGDWQSTRPTTVGVYKTVVECTAAAHKEAARSRLEYHPNFGEESRGSIDHLFRPLDRRALAGFVFRDPQSGQYFDFLCMDVAPL